MPDYRLYMLTDDGHIMRAPFEFESPSDEEAVANAQQHRDGRDLELWQKDRLVKAIPKLD